MSPTILRLQAKTFNITKAFPFYFFRWMHDHYAKLPLHSHDFIELVFVWNGSATHIFNSRQFGRLEYKIYPGDIFIVSPGEEHTYHLDPGEKVEIINMLFYPEMLESSLLFESYQAERELMDFLYVQPFLQKEARFSSILKLDAIAAEEVMTLVAKIEKEYTAQQKGYQSLVKLLLTELVLRLGRFYSERPRLISERLLVVQGGTKDKLNRVLGYMEHHYNTDFSVEQLAEMASCSERQFARLFKQATGTTVINYLHNLRIERAQKMLSRTNEKIAAIGMEVGFHDISFFNRIFKRIVGMSPKEYQAGLSRGGELEGRTAD